MLSAWVAVVESSVDSSIDEAGEEEQYYNEGEEKIIAVDQASSPVPARLREGSAEKWRKKICRATFPLQHSSLLRDFEFSEKTKEPLHFDSTLDSWRGSHHEKATTQKLPGFLETVWSIAAYCCMTLG